jgi:hypothetical protein
MSKQEEFIKAAEEKMLPQKVVLNYFQHWGQSVQDRIDTLKELANAIGFNVEIELTSNDKEVGVRFGDEHTKALWPQFFQDLNACWPLGHFEDEEEAIRKVIEKYREMIATAV